MKRILLAICLSLAASLAFAGQGAQGVDPQPECPKAAAKAQASTPAVDAAGSGVVSTDAKVRGGGGSSTRLVSPRWHSLLPGMFR